MSTELTTSYAAQINSLYQRCMAMDDVIKDAILSKINRAIETGVLLISAKQAVGPGRWMQWTRDNLTFCHKTATSLMDFARKNNCQLLTDMPEGVHSLYSAMIACGSLPEPKRVPQGRRPGGFFNALTSYATKLVAHMRGGLEKKPITEWSVEEKRKAKAELLPAVELYQKLSGLDKY